MPPVGKLDASGSPWISVLPANSAIAPPSPSGDEEAVVLLGGEAGERIEDVRVVGRALLDRPVLHRRRRRRRRPWDRASTPVSIVFFSDLKTSFGRCAFIAAWLKTLTPKSLSIGTCENDERLRDRAIGGDGLDGLEPSCRSTHGRSPCDGRWLGRNRPVRIREQATCPRRCDSPRAEVGRVCADRALPIAHCRNRAPDFEAPRKPPRRSGSPTPRTDMRRRSEMRGTWMKRTAAVAVVLAAATMVAGERDGEATRAVPAAAVSMLGQDRARRRATRPDGRRRSRPSTRSDRRGAHPAPRAPRSDPRGARADADGARRDVAVARRGARPGGLDRRARDAGEEDRARGGREGPLAAHGRAVEAAPGAARECSGRSWAPCRLADAGEPSPGPGV